MKLLETKKYSYARVLESNHCKIKALSHYSWNEYAKIAVFFPIKEFYHEEKGLHKRMSCRHAQIVVCVDVITM